MASAGLEKRRCPHRMQFIFGSLLSTLQQSQSCLFVFVCLFCFYVFLHLFARQLGMIHIRIHIHILINVKSRDWTNCDDVKYKEHQHIHTYTPPPQNNGLTMNPTHLHHMHIKANWSETKPTRMIFNIESKLVRDWTNVQHCNCVQIKKGQTNHTNLQISHTQNTYVEKKTNSTNTIYKCWPQVRRNNSFVSRQQQWQSKDNTT